MDFTYAGQRYLISWRHVDDPDATQKFLDENRPSLALSKTYKGRIPLKKQRFRGYTLCEIRTIDPALIDTETKGWTTVFTGYAFCRADEKTFDKALGRRVSLQDAITGRFDYTTRAQVWTAFNAKWPNVSPTASMWERRYNQKAQELAAAQARYKGLEARINALAATVLP